MTVRGQYIQYTQKKICPTLLQILRFYSDMIYDVQRKEYAFVLISVCDSDNLTSHVTDEAVVVVTITEDDPDEEDCVPLDTLDYKMVKMKLDTQ